MTGVQTCALPISGTRAAGFRSARADALRVLAGLEAIVVLGAINFSSFSAMTFLGADVSSFKAERKLAADCRLVREYPNSYSFCNAYSVIQSLPCHMGSIT